MHEIRLKFKSHSHSFNQIFMIPEAKKEAVSQALQITFGVNHPDAVTPLTAGLSSALIFKIMVLGKPYLLRIITRTDAMADPARWFASMEAAAAIGIAPRVWYANSGERICITDFIEPAVFPISKARALLPVMLRRLHSLPSFPYRMNYLDFADGVIRKMCAVKEPAAYFTGDILRQYERIIKVYPRNNEDLTACHNDLKPDNILFDGEHAWLADWEAAFLNDRYVDLAVIANFVLETDHDEKDYLENYFGSELNEYRRARFFLMRQLMHMVYWSFFTSLAMADGKTIDPPAVIAGFREFHDLLWQGKINLLEKEAQQQYAMVHLQQVEKNFRLQRLEDALRIVAGTHPASAAK